MDIALTIFLARHRKAEVNLTGKSIESFTALVIGGKSRISNDYLESMVYLPTYVRLSSRVRCAQSGVSQGSVPASLPAESQGLREPPVSQARGGSPTTHLIYFPFPWRNTISSSRDSRADPGHSRLQRRALQALACGNPEESAAARRGRTEGEAGACAPRRETLGFTDPLTLQCPAARVERIHVSRPAHCMRPVRPSTAPHGTASAAPRRAGGGA
ncbi:unnamed protein product [Chrysodeixis includens]|uniref:Uncharacterized protein n=1 Tax=Chrysodeixis includens TaxID=689277 RepID=A0A9N8L1A4_CHRIL|nr:unnamed protein product [Chrysodeixis includens]